MVGWTAKRFYQAAVVQASVDGFAIVLDGRPARTPAGGALVAPSPVLAQAIADEWDAQVDRVRPETMPLTRLAATAVDRVSAAPEETVAHVVSHAAFDLLCYRASGPEELVVRQERAWQPLVDWAQDALGAPFAITRGVLPVAQDGRVLAAVGGHLAGLDAFRLTAVADIVQTAGSAILGLALFHGRVSAAEVCALALLDEAYQADRWGWIDEVHERRRRLDRDLAASARFLALLGSPDGGALPTS